MKDIDKIKNQMNIINVLGDMVKNSMQDYIEYERKYSEWYSKEPRQWSERPDRTTTVAQLKRLMLIKRQEMIKLDKMLTSNYY
jgi:hypothetical protein